MTKLTEKQISLIKQKITIKDDVFIVRMKMVVDKDITTYESNHNIYCVNKDYEIIWQVQVDSTGVEEDPFINVSLWEGKELMAAKFSGFHYRIDIETGHAEQTGWAK